MRTVKKIQDGSQVIQGSLTVLGGINNPDFGKTITRLATTGQDVNVIKGDVAQIHTDIDPFINATPPTANVTDLSLAAAANNDGSMEVKLDWLYTQGTVPATGFLVYAKRDAATPGAIVLATDPCLYVPFAVGVLAYSTSLTLATRQIQGDNSTLPIHYRFGVIAVALASDSVAYHTGGVVEDSGWIDKTFASNIGVDANNYWDLDTGEFRTGTADSFIKIAPADGTVEIAGLDLSLTQSDLTSYSGAGANRIATRLKAGELQFINSPEGGSESIIGRIGRLGSVPSVLIDGNLCAKATNSSGIANVIQAGSVSQYSPAVIKFNGLSRAAYAVGTTVYDLNSDGLEWDATPLTVSTGTTFTHLAYAITPAGVLELWGKTSAGALYKSVFSGTSWGAMNSVSLTVSPSASMAVIYDGSEPLIIIKMDSSDIRLYRYTSSWAYTTLWAGSSYTQPTLVLVNGSIYAFACYNTLYYRKLTAGAWGSSTSLPSKASPSSVDSYLDINGVQHISYESGGACYSFTWDGTTQGASETLGTCSTAMAIVAEFFDGSLRILFGDASGLQEYVTYRYVQLGAGIIDSGVTVDGINYQILSDGTTHLCMNEIVSNQAISSAYGSLFQGTRVYNISEFGLLSLISVHCTFFKWGTSASWGTIGAASTTSITARGLDVTSRATGTLCNVAWDAWGRWK